VEDEVNVEKLKAATNKRVVAHLGGSLDWPLKGILDGVTSAGLAIVRDPKTGYGYAVEPENVELEA